MKYFLPLLKPWKRWWKIALTVTGSPDALWTNWITSTGIFYPSWWGMMLWLFWGGREQWWWGSSGNGPYLLVLLQLCVDPLWWESADTFCKRPDGKYFQLGGLGVYVSGASTQLCCCHTKYIKAWLWPDLASAGCSLPTPRSMVFLILIQNPLTLARTTRLY